MTYHITQSLTERLRAFSDDDGDFPFYLSQHVGKFINWKDVSLIYIESVIRRLYMTKGMEIGAAFFIEEIKHSYKHYMWFALVASNKKTFDALCTSFDKLRSQDPGYIYEYYVSIFRSEDNPQNAHPDLKARFESRLSAENAFNVKPPIPGRVVHFWSPPSALSVC